MGCVWCLSSKSKTEEKKDEKKNEKKKDNNKKKNNKKGPKLVTADERASHQIEIKEIDKTVEILHKGEKEEIEKMVDSLEDINDYSFGSNKTLLIQAVINCSNPEVIDIIMEKGADINKAESETGNTALFLSAVDLKVDFVKTLLKYKPNLKHKNHNNQDIFEFLNFNLFEKRGQIGRELTEEEKENYSEIEKMLKNYADEN